MKSSITLLFLFIALALANCNEGNHNTTTDEIGQLRQYYQLKIFSLETETQVLSTDSYLKDALLPALKRLEIQPVGVFKPWPSETDSLKRIYVLIPFSSLDQFSSLESSLDKDNVYLSAGRDYINSTYDHPPYKRIESILLKAFEDMPVMRPTSLDGPRADRIYELRSYESVTESIFRNKLDMFNAGGEIKLFDQLKFNAVFYGEVISGPKMPNLMYMTTHADSITRATNWKNFVESAKWKELSSLPKYQNNVSHIDITFLYPTDYSNY